jgi:hypothetical protein
MPLPAIPPMTVTGDVVAVHSHWTSDGSRIVTEATVRTADGSDVVVSQLGGSVDGIGMITFPGPERLALGMQVAVGAHMDVDLSQHSHVMLDSVQVMTFAPHYVRTGPTQAGHYLAWKSGCVFVTVDAAGTTALAGDDEFAIIDKSIATWNDGTEACSYLQVMNQGRKALEVGNDKVNLIKFRDTTWGRPAIKDDAARLYSSSAAGITTAVYIDDATSDRDGEIIDADVELNGVNFEISENCAQGNPQPSTCVSLHQPTANVPDNGPADLQNTLTHELGHLHGLEHPCLAQGDPDRKDNLGNPVPSCFESGLPATITEATMYNFQDPGETKKQTLSPDDIQAICEIYPIAKDPGTCSPVGQDSGGCCSVASRTERSDLSILLAGATVLTVVRRRKRR